MLRINDFILNKARFFLFFFINLLKSCHIHVIHCSIKLFKPIVDCFMQPNCILWQINELFSLFGCCVTHVNNQSLFKFSSTVKLSVRERNWPLTLPLCKLCCSIYPIQSVSVLQKNISDKQNLKHLKYIINTVCTQSYHHTIRITAINSQK